MSDNSNIEWTDATWNPTRGCLRVSEGCRNCYAEKVAYRFSGPGQPYEGLVRMNAAAERVAEWNGRIRLAEDHLLDPLKWRKPRRIFVNSMSDLFHKDVPNEYIDRVFAVMALCPQHTFQILTKRTIRCWDYWFLQGLSARFFWIAHAIDELFPVRTTNTIRAMADLVESDRPLPNVLHGFSAEDQETFDKRWNAMCRFPTNIFRTMASIEPLINFIDMGSGRQPNWVIVGGESGPGARPCNVEWIRSIVKQCKKAGVPCFVKQLGTKPTITSLGDCSGCLKPDPYGSTHQMGTNQHPSVLALHSKKGGDIEEWPHDLRVREFPEVQP